MKITGMQCIAWHGVDARGGLTAAVVVQRMPFVWPVHDATGGWVVGAAVVGAAMVEAVGGGFVCNKAAGIGRFGATFRSRDDERA